MDGAPSDIRRGEVHLRAVGAWGTGRASASPVHGPTGALQTPEPPTHGYMHRSHWEPVYGSNLQAKAYCTKEATRVSGPWEYGCLSCVGKRRGLEEAIECVKGGVPLHVVAAEFSMAWVSHGKGLTSLRQQLKLDQDRRSFGPEGPEVWVLWGPSGTGKSRFVAARWPDAFWKAPESKWWDGYSGHETVVLDDFKDYGMPLVDLQRLTGTLVGRGQGGASPCWPRGTSSRRTLPDDWYVRGDPHRTIRRRIADFAERFGRLIECQAGWEPPGAAWAGAEVQGNTSTAPEPQPLGDDIMSAIANWQDN